jgi:hypothetical protein
MRLVILGDWMFTAVRLVGWFAEAGGWKGGNSAS